MKKFIVGMSTMAIMATMMSSVASAEGLKTIRIESVPTVGTTTDQKAGVIEIKEPEKNSWELSSHFKLTLPSTMKWNEKTTIDPLIIKKIDGSTLEFDALSGKDIQTTIKITPYIDIDRTTAQGSVSALIAPIGMGDKEEYVDIAKITGYSASLEANAVKSVTNSRSIPVEFILNENVGNSFLPGNLYDITFENATIAKDSFKLEQIEGKDDLKINKIGEDYATFELSKENSAEKGKWKVKAELIPNKDFQGDITATVKGRGLEETGKTIISTVSQGIQVQTRTPDNIYIGKQDQSITDVSFTEQMRGALPVGDYILRVDPAYKGMSLNNANLAVTNGDMRISSAKTDGSSILFRVTTESFKPSTLTLNNLKVTLDRFGYDGQYNLILANAKDPQKELAKVTLFNVTNEVNKTKDQVVFTIGQKVYRLIQGQTVNQKDLDVAPYIAVGNRTMIPVRATGEMLNMEVQWNAKSSTATLISQDRTKVVVLTLGSKVMIVNGKAMPLDAAPEIKGSRMFLPIGQIAEALDLKPMWDQATKTVTLERY